MAKKRKSTNTSLLYLAILALALIMLPILVNAVESRAFSSGYAAGTNMMYSK